MPTAAIVRPRAELAPAARLRESDRPPDATASCTTTEIGYLSTLSYVMHDRGTLKELPSLFEYLLDSDSCIANGVLIPPVGTHPVIALQVAAVGKVMINVTELNRSGDPQPGQFLLDVSLSLRQRPVSIRSRVPAERSEREDIQPGFVHGGVKGMQRFVVTLGLRSAPDLRASIHSRSGPTIPMMASIIGVGRLV